MRMHERSTCQEGPNAREAHVTARDFLILFVSSLLAAIPAPKRFLVRWVISALLIVLVYLLSGSVPSLLSGAAA